MNFGGLWPPCSSSFRGFFFYFLFYFIFLSFYFLYFLYFFLLLFLFFFVLFIFFVLFVFFVFLPTPLAVAWVFRLTFSPSSPSPSHFQLFVSVRYRKRCGGSGSLAVYAILFFTVCLSYCLFFLFVFFFLPISIFVFFVFLRFCLFAFLPFCLFSFCIFAFLPFCYHYHNHGVHIYYHTNFYSNPIFFSSILPHILPYILPQNLPQTTTTIATHPPTTFSVPKRNTGKCFERPAKILRGRQRFGDNL